MRSFSFDFFYLANTQSFCFFHFVRLTETTQITLRNALGIPHYSQLSHFLSIPFISLNFRTFQGVSALRFASALANANEEKERKRRNLSHTLLHSHTARALCPDSEIMREKRIERERKRYGQSWGKKKNIEKKGEYGELPFWEYWVLPRNIHTHKKARK